MNLVEIQKIEGILPIAGFSGYWICSDGRVFSRWVRNRIRENGMARELKPFLVGGYKRVGLYRDGVMYPMSIHVLLLDAFVGPCPNGYQCRHIDGNPSNNSLNNLAWGTPQENCDDKTRHGRTPKGSTHKRSRLVEYQVAELKALYRQGATVASLARKYAVTPGCVDFIVREKTWKHVKERSTNGTADSTAETAAASAAQDPF